MADAGGGLTPAAATPPPAELLAALPQAVLAVDAAGVVRDLNAAAEALLNLARVAAVGRGVEELTGQALAALPPDRPFAAYDLDIMLPHRRPARADIGVAPLPDRPGWRVVAIHARGARDLAARRGERADRALPAAAAAAMLAHEVKNPLSGIRGAAQLLDSGASAAQLDLTRLIRREVDRVAALIDRMEGLTDTRPLPLAPLNVHAVLGHARDVAAHGFARGRAIREFYDPSLPDAVGDRDALVQVLLNLLKNAVEASGPDGAILLRTAYSHGYSTTRFDGGRRALPIEVAVIDEGPGPPAAIAAHLFDPFVTSKPAGTGLGLALTEKLVDAMGGLVEFARENGRTVFRVLLPRAGTAA